MWATYATTRNLVAAGLAPTLAHSVHNPLLRTWPGGYGQWVTQLRPQGEVDHRAA